VKLVCASIHSRADSTFANMVRSKLVLLDSTDELSVMDRPIQWKCRKDMFRSSD
jgi:hypothetical protein